MPRQGRDLLLAEAYLARANREQAGDALDDRRAPGPVAPHESHNLVAIDVDRHVAQDVGGASIGIDVAYLEQHGQAELRLSTAHQAEYWQRLYWRESHRACHRQG